jgi:hypothetical protein
MAGLNPAAPQAAVDQGGVKILETPLPRTASAGLIPTLTVADTFRQA